MQFQARQNESVALKVRIAVAFGGGVCKWGMWEHMHISVCSVSVFS